MISFMASPTLTVDRLSTSDRFDTPLMVKANKTDGIFNNWIFYGSPDNYQAPEHRLMVAVLEDAIDCAYHEVRSHKNARRDQAEALKWIFDLTADATFSFNAICETLGLDPGWVRKGLGKR
jgi:hypothetical protein